MSSATPRSGRAKKKSTLSRLANNKAIHTPHDSDDDEDDRPSLRDTTSRDDLAAALHRQRLNSNRYTEDSEEYGREYHRYGGYNEEEMETRHSYGYGSSRNTSRLVEKDEVTDEDESEEERSESRRYVKGEKRLRDQNSDGDDLGNDVGRSRSRKELLRGNTKNSYHDNSEDEDDIDNALAHQSTSPLRSRLTFRQTREDITSTYKDALERMEREEAESNDSAEMSDSLGDLERFRHPPRKSTRSPDLREFHRHDTNMSMASTMSSRNFRNNHQREDIFGDVSQASNVSSSLLPLISTKEARNRSFLVGTITGGGSLLGAEELEKYFPDRKVRIFLGTWNMCEMKEIPECLDDFLLPETSEYIHDMYVIGTQESCSNRRELEIALQQTLGPQHLLIHTASHGVLYICIFLRRDLIWYTSVCEEGAVTTRPGPINIRTKGAVAVSVSLFGTSFLFLNSHFSPHDGRIKDRIADYAKICAGLQLPKQSSAHQDTDVTARFDCVFWLGDLNFRIEKERDRVDHKMQGIEATQDIRNFEELVIHDELSRARNEGLAFQDFQEGRIKFKPTYKYDKGTDNFDSSKKMRIPSYTDRILVRTKKKNSANCLHYDCAFDVRASDHKPVYAVYEVDLRPKKKKVPTATLR